MVGVVGHSPGPQVGEAGMSGGACVPEGISKAVGEGRFGEHQVFLDSGCHSFCLAPTVCQALCRTPFQQLRGKASSILPELPLSGCPARRDVTWEVQPGSQAHFVWSQGRCTAPGGLEVQNAAQV